ncbi:MAG: bestrophin family protein [Myxococcota bacterium]
MLVRFPSNPLRVGANILRLNRGEVASLLAIPAVYLLVDRWLMPGEVHLDYRPVGVLGTGVAIILGFRNNSAYDRWWEARKIWGGLVNASRTFSVNVLTLLRPPSSSSTSLVEECQRLQRRIVYRHLAFLHAVRLQLRELQEWDCMAPFLDENEKYLLESAVNRASQLNLAQAKDLALAREKGWLDAYSHVSLLRSLEDNTDLQGKAERIKGTVFPLYYSMYTRLFVWLFAILFPATLLRELGLLTLPVSTVVSFVFVMLERTARITENPFMNLAGDTPMTALCRIIEIDLRQHLGETSIPSKLTTSRSEQLGTEYLM